MSTPSSFELSAFILKHFIFLVHHPSSGGLYRWFHSPGTHPQFLGQTPGPSPGWSHPFPWQGSDGRSDCVSILRSLSLPGCSYLRPRTYPYSRQQPAVVSAFCPPWLPHQLLTEQAASGSPCVPAAAAQQPRFLFPFLQHPEASDKKTSAPQPYQPTALRGAGRGKWEQK